MNDEFIDIDRFPQYLESLRQEDWQPLLDLIPEIEKTRVFEEKIGGEAPAFVVGKFIKGDQIV